MTAAQRAEVERLRAIGYLAGSKLAPSTSGVTVHDRESAQPGLNFMTSGDRPGAVLMNMDGDVLHRWELPFLEAFPDSQRASASESAAYWRFAHPFENGDVLAVFEGLGLIKVDRRSRLLWAHAGGEHHALDVTDDGRIYVLTRRAHLNPSINTEEPVLEDFVTVMDARGRVIKSVSVLRAFQNSYFITALTSFGMKNFGDLMHTNAIDVLDGRIADRIPAFSKGNVLVSIRQLDIIAVIDMEREAVVWIGGGLWRAQHDSKVLPNGNLMLFDNKGQGGLSKVIEYDPATQRIYWVYYGTKEAPLYSEMCGACHRLANGNTLVVESDFGRVAEVTVGGDVVWEYLNPARAGDEDELIATIFDMVRLPGDFGARWID